MEEEKDDKLDTGLSRQQGTGLKRTVSTGMRRRKDGGEEAPAETSSRREPEHSEEEKPQQRAEPLNLTPPAASSKPRSSSPKSTKIAEKPESKSKIFLLIIGFILLAIFGCFGMFFVADLFGTPAEPNYWQATACTWERTVTVERPVVSRSEGWRDSCYGENCKVINSSCRAKVAGTREEEIPGAWNLVVIGQRYEPEGCDLLPGIVDSCTQVATQCDWEDTGECGWVDTGECEWVDMGDGFEEYQCEEEWTCEQDYTCDYQEVCPTADPFIEAQINSCKQVDATALVPATRWVEYYEDWCNLERNSWEEEKFVVSGNTLPATDPQFTAGLESKVSKDTLFTLSFKEEDGDRTAQFTTRDIEAFNCKIGATYELEWLFGHVTAYSLVER